MERLQEEERVGIGVNVPHPALDREGEGLPDNVA